MTDARDAIGAGLHIQVYYDDEDVLESEYQPGMAGLADWLRFTSEEMNRRESQN